MLPWFDSLSQGQKLLLCGLALWLTILALYFSRILRARWSEKPDFLAFDPALTPLPEVAAARLDPQRSRLEQAGFELVGAYLYHPLPPSKLVAMVLLLVHPQRKEWAHLSAQVIGTAGLDRLVTSDLQIRSYPADGQPESILTWNTSQVVLSTDPLTNIVLQVPHVTDADRLLELHHIAVRKYCGSGKMAWLPGSPARSEQAFAGVRLTPQEIVELAQRQWDRTWQGLVRRGLMWQMPDGDYCCGLRIAIKLFQSAVFPLSRIRRVLLWSKSRRLERELILWAKHHPDV